MFQLEIVKKYFKNIAANLVFSAVLILIFCVKLRLIGAETVSSKEYIVLFICELLISFFVCIHTSVIMKRITKHILKTAFSVFLWGLFFFAESIAVRSMHMNCTMSRAAFFVICTAVYAILFGIMVLSFCQCICDYNRTFVLLSGKNILFFMKAVIYSAVALVAVCIAAFTPVNTRGSRRNIVYVPKEVTKKWEPRIFSVILFFLLPLYSIVFIQMFEDVSTKK